MIIAIANMNARMPSGWSELVIAPANICTPIEYRPNLKMRKTRTSRMTRRKPRPTSPWMPAALMISVIQNGKIAARSIRFIAPKTKGHTCRRAGRRRRRCRRSQRCGGAGGGGVQEAAGHAPSGT